MSLAITLLGTGSPMPSPDRAGPATLISAGTGPEAEHYLVDAGRGVLMRLAAIGLGAPNLATDGAVNADGVAYRQELEDRLDRLASEPWCLLGADLSRQFLDLVQPVTDVLVARIDATAGPNWMPAARPHKQAKP